MNATVASQSAEQLKLPAFAARGSAIGAVVAVLSLVLCGCAPVMLAGSAIRSHEKHSDVVLASGVTTEMLQQRRNLGLSINAMDGSGRYLAGYAGGTSNTSVFSDMISKEFLRLGYQSRVIADTVSEMMSETKRNALAAEGFDMILVGNLNLATSSSYASAMTGGNWATAGVTSFTIKGIDTKTGGVLFILSNQYGTSKSATDVATDLSQMYRDVLAGTLKPSK